VFDALWNGSGPDADAVIEAQGLKQMSDAGEMEALVDQAISAHPKSVEEFRAGKEKALNALVGQVMKASRGKANPQAISEILRKKLS
jgi:aspartyl-tRNA(Asn)/glutamyl-tRNA(Gln) amidotransferase subunit B